MKTESQHLSVAELSRRYAFPKDFDGSGETLGIIAMAGGYHRSDIEAMFRSIDRPMPELIDVGVPSPDGRGANRPSSMADLAALAKALRAEQVPTQLDALATLETTMDVQLAAAFAPGARVVVYFAPARQPAGLYYTLLTAVHDSVNRPSVLSISWGWPEPRKLADSAELQEIMVGARELFDLARSRGITLCASSGDTGSGDPAEGDTPKAGEGRFPGADWVQFPASSPYALACGGTTLDGSSESSWNIRLAGHSYASGGGASRAFDRPTWQQGVIGDALGPRGRGVPDVAGLADQRFGSTFFAGGETLGSAGTSAATPLWAALITRLNQALGTRLGHLNPRIYRLAAADPTLFRDVIAGTNGEFQASDGWDPVTGWGSPHGERLLEALREDLQQHP
ncbi:MAG: S53 family peptidase [Acidobacteriota bacterium]